MTERSDHPQIVVVYGDGSSYPDADTVQALSDRGFLSGQMSGTFPHAAHAAILGRGDLPPVYDPHQVHREFPGRWQSYIRANYRNLSHVQRVFGVSERTSRKWWNGETGANGGHVAIAVNEHPVAAPRMLFAAE